MKNAKCDITILVIGDNSDYDSYKKADHEKRTFGRNGFEYASTNYTQLLKGNVPPILTPKLILFFFFPFTHWNKHIEHKNYKGIYGNQIFYRKFVRFWKIVDHKIAKVFRDKEIFFVNHPHICGAYRDKMAVIKKLQEFRISQPRIYQASNIQGVQKNLTRGRNLFLKVRYGSMGKGITYLSPYNWQTNFIFRDNKIISRKSDHGWKFRSITGNHRFLRTLLKKDIIVQEGVNPLILNGHMVDLRIYTFMNKVLYVYPRKNSLSKITTNISQGGRGDPKVLQQLPKHLVAMAKKEAIRISKKLKIGMAGIDIIPDRNLEKVSVIDVNVFAGFPKRKTFNLARYMAEELRRLHHKKKLIFNRYNT